MLERELSLEYRLLLVALAFFAAWFVTNQSTPYTLTFLPEDAIKVDCTGNRMSTVGIPITSCAAVKSSFEKNCTIVLFPKNVGTEQLAEMWRGLYNRSDIYASDL